jgi:hypothetical protein
MLSLCVQSAATLQELLPIFEQRFGYFFCFISIPRLQDKIANEEASPILLNAICAVSARYSKSYASQTPAEPEMESYPTSARNQHHTNRATAYSGDVFAQKAKTQALKVLSVSDLDVCSALLILSWNEFGCDRDTVSNVGTCSRLTGLLMVIRFAGTMDVSALAQRGDCAIRSDLFQVFRNGGTHVRGLR